MLRTIKLSVDKVITTPTSTITHTGTSYQVSTTTDFTVPSNLIVNINNSTVDLLSHTFTHDVLPGQPLYARTRYHFSNGSLSDWSNIVEITSNQFGIKSSNTLVSTPSVSGKYDYANVSSGELVITVGNIGVYAGIGNIVSMSWTVESTDGEVLYEVLKSPDILTELRIPMSELGGNQIVIVSVQTHTDTNTDSNVSRAVVETKQTVSEYFIANMIETLYNNYTNIVSISSNLYKYTAAEIRVIAADGTIVGTYNNLDPVYPSFYISGLSNSLIYTVEVRAVDISGVHTPWVIVYKGAASIPSARTYSPYVNYVTTHTGFGAYIDIDGLSTQSLVSDKEGFFYMAIPGTTTLNAYRYVNGALYPTSNVFDLGPGELHPIPSLSVVRLDNGDLLLDHSMGIYNGVEQVSKFTKVRYNRIDKSMSPVQSLVRPDERFGTGGTNSIVAKGNLVYYVPGRIVDANGASLDLEVRIYDTTTDTIVGSIPLPVPGLKLNVTISEDINGDIYMFGGTGDMAPNATHGELAATLINSDIYKLSLAGTPSWTMVHTMTGLVPESYRYRMQTLLNGKIFIVDTTPDLIGTPDRSSYLFNTITNTVEATILNTPRQEHIGITIDMHDGDLGFISSTPEISEATSFLVTTTSSTLLNDNAMLASNPVTDLVIPVGKTVHVRDPYRYNSITIEGTSLANTGVLAWTRNGVTTEYYYNDLIVTRNMTINSATAPVYNRVIVVGDAILTTI